MMKIALSLMTHSVRCLDCAVEVSMSGITLKHVDHVIEVNEAIIDGNNIPLKRLIEDSGNQIHSLQILPLCLRDTVDTV